MTSRRKAEAAVISNMGDGDLVDPADLGATDDGADSTVHNAAPTDDHADTSGGDMPERDSEIDDVTDSLRRPEDPPGDGDGDDDGDGEPDFSDVDVAAVLAEREEFRNIAQRVQADFDNFRKRSIAQAAADADRATGRLAEALLPVLDAAEAAFLRHPDEVGPLLNQMLTELKKHGLQALDLDGKPFDPEVAEAVHHEPGEGGEPVVTEVLRSGYQWKGRTLRPAMVKTKD